MENFPCTRVAGAELPSEPAPIVQPRIAGLSPAQVRAAAPDGVLGGAYARPDEDMLAVWAAGVAEVRALLTDGWTR